MPGLAAAQSARIARLCPGRASWCPPSSHARPSGWTGLAAAPQPALPAPRAPRQHRRRGLRRAAAAAAASGSGAMGSPQELDSKDLEHLLRAAQVSQGPVGQTQPHPYAACVLVSAQGVPLAEAAQLAQGTEPPECQAVRAAGPAARGATAYLNLETGDCHGDAAAVQALLSAGVARVVVGLRHPLPHLRGAAIAALRGAGVAVAVLGEAPCSAAEAQQEAALDAVLQANDALLHRAVLRRPLGLLKYAMTLDGKIATHTGHSAWVSSPASRQRVFDARAASDAVIVGGCTVRRDNPQLTTRRPTGHQPARIVMSRTLDLPAEAKLWDVVHAPTIVATQRGARVDFQNMLRARGVEVLEFDFLTPDAVARYCYDRGYLQCLWECGGMLAAPAIAGGAIHKAMAFVAPKIIGGSRAPTPVGDLGFVEMTQALHLADVQWQQVGPDLMLTGYLPHSGGLRALAAAAAAADGSDDAALAGNGGVVLGGGAAGRAGSSSSEGLGLAAASRGSPRHPGSQLEQSGVAEFYKAWDRYGCLSNFSPHPIAMPPGPMTAERAQQLHAASSGPAQQQQQAEQQHGGQQHGGEQAAAAAAAGSGGAAAAGGPSSSGEHASSSGGGGNGSGASSWRVWPSVEHYYQAQKFAGVAKPEAEALVESIHAAGSPEEAAGLGRRAQRQHPHLVRPDWEAAKVAAMLAALRAKCAAHDGPRAMLLATARNCGGRGCDASGARVGALQVSGAAAAGASSAGSSGRGGGSSSSGGGSGGAVGLELVESSPHDFFWGRGYDGSGANMLGKLLMQVRQELLSGGAGGPAGGQHQQQQGEAAGALAAGVAREQQQEEEQRRRPAGV